MILATHNLQAKSLSTAKRYALPYYFKIETGPTEATLFPCLDPDPAKAPYYIVRRAIERALAEDRATPDPLAQLAVLGAPTADIDQMLAEIEAGRS